MKKPKKKTKRVVISDEDWEKHGYSIRGSDFTSDAFEGTLEVTLWEHDYDKKLYAVTYLDKPADKACCPECLEVLKKKSEKLSGD